MRLGREVRLILVEPEDIDVDEVIMAEHRAELEAYKAERLAQRRQASERHSGEMRRRSDPT